MLTCLCAAPSVHYLIGRIRGKKIIQTLCAFLLVASLAWNYYYLFHRWNEIGLYKPILGLESESSFLKRIVPGYPVMDYINRSCRILLGYTAFGQVDMLFIWIDYIIPIHS